MINSFLISDLNNNNSKGKIRGEEIEIYHKSCGDDHSIIQEGDIVKIVNGNVGTGFKIDNIPSKILFECDTANNACYKRPDSTIVCYTQKSSNIRGIEERSSNDVKVDTVNTDNICYHHKDEHFGWTTVLHEDGKACNSKKKSDDVIIVKKNASACILNPKPELDAHMSAFPYWSEEEIQRKLNEYTDEEKKLVMEQASEWAKLVYKNGKAFIPKPCENIGELCGFDSSNDSYNGQCILIKDGTSPVCRSFQESFYSINNDEDLINADKYLELNQEQKFSKTDYCKEKSDDGVCKNTVLETNTVRFGDICENPYFEKNKTYTCYYNRHDIDSEKTIYSSKTHNFLTPHMDEESLHLSCIDKDKGYGFVTQVKKDGESLCLVLDEPNNGNIEVKDGIKRGSVCIPYEL
tara:strand:+ start:7656 stop:8876 length:1221 start_codon:yes stop_codon:yes gene_type:complete